MGADATRNSARRLLRRNLRSREAHGISEALRRPPPMRRSSNTACPWRRHTDLRESHPPRFDELDARLQVPEVASVLAGCETLLPTERPPSPAPPRLLDLRYDCGYTMMT
jgi:hypothetical protein